MPRVAGAGIVYLLFLCIVALIVSLLVPVVTRQVSQAVQHFPDYLADAQAFVRRVGARFGQEPNFRLDADQVRAWLEETFQEGDVGERLWVLQKLREASFRV